MALYCANCGKMLGDDARFCSGCGRPVMNPATAGIPQGVRPPLVRPRNGRKIAGVCRGLADHFGWDIILTRVLAVVLAIVLFPLGIVAYLVFWLIVPEDALALPPAIPPSAPMNPTT